MEEETLHHNTHERNKRLVRVGFGGLGGGANVWRDLKKFLTDPSVGEGRGIMVAVTDPQRNLSFVVLEKKPLCPC